MPEIDYDALIRSTRSCDTLTAVAWCMQRRMIADFCGGAGDIDVGDGDVYGHGPTLSAAVLDCVLAPKTAGAGVRT